MKAWDLAVVGAGPAGAAAAIGALRVDPSLRVALLDRSDFPATSPAATASPPMSSACSGRPASLGSPPTMCRSDGFA